MLSECICIESWWRDLEPSFACHYMDQSQPEFKRVLSAKYACLEFYSLALIK